MKDRAAGWATGLWAVCLLASTAAILLPRVPYRLERTTITSEAGPLSVEIYRPLEQADLKWPAAVVAHPLNNPPEFSRALALELVQQGFIVLTFDWRGGTPEQNRQTRKDDSLQTGRQDVLSGVHYLQSLPDVDPARVMTAGHSVGATFAIEAAMQDSSIAGVAGIGMEAEVTSDAPRNLLWAVGLYDEFRSLGAMRKAMSVSAGGAAVEGETKGSIAAGTGRRLAV